MTPPDLSAWGWAEDLHPFPGGARREVWRARINGRDVLAKSHALAEPDLRWHLRLESHANRVGIETPGLIPTTSGALSSGGWTVEPFLDGERGQLSDLRRLPIPAFHRAARTMPPRPSALRPILSPFLRRLTRLRGPRGAIHGDLHPGNLIRRPGGQLALLDWHEARIDTYAIDLAALDARRPHPVHLRAEIAACAGPEPGRARHLTRVLLARNWP